MLARELGFLQGFRLSGRGPRGAIGDPRERFLILNLATVRGPSKSRGRRALLQWRCVSSRSHRDRAAKPRRLRSGDYAQGVHMIWFSSLARPVALIALGMCFGMSPATAEPRVKDVLKTYADIAQAGYADFSPRQRRCSLRSISFWRSRPTKIFAPPEPPGSPRASPICRPRPIASAIPSSMTGRAR